MVLLKNDGILPLDKTALDRIAVLGPNAAEPRVMGGGSAQINAHYKVSRSRASSARCQAPTASSTSMPAATTA